MHQHRAPGSCGIAGQQPEPVCAVICGAALHKQCILPARGVNLPGSANLSGSACPGQGKHLQWAQPWVRRRNELCWWQESHTHCAFQDGPFAFCICFKIPFLWLPQTNLLDVWCNHLFYLLGVCPTLNFGSLCNRLKKLNPWIFNLIPLKETITVTAQFPPVEAAEWFIILLRKCLISFF